MNKKGAIRQRFRNRCYARDGWQCVMCGHRPVSYDWEEYHRTGQNPPIDVHHITDRNLLPKGGYVPENGISLCASCHLMAEVYHRTGESHPGYSPNDLYDKIGSSFDKAFQKSLES